MKIKGKVFNRRAVLGLLARDKSMFREICKKQPPENLLGESSRIEKDKAGNFILDNGKELFHFDKPRFQKGDRIFVKEHFIDVEGKIIFQASSKKLVTQLLGLVKWNSARCMKQEQSRLTLEITDVGIKRLRDLPSCELLREMNYCSFSSEPFRQNYLAAKHVPEYFQTLGRDRVGYNLFIDDWDSTHKKQEHKWEANPWVFVYQFCIIKN